MSALLGLSLFWLASALLLYGGIAWRLKHPGTRSADRLNSIAAAGGLFLAFYALYGAVALALLWAGYGLWRWLA